ALAETVLAGGRAAGIPDAADGRAKRPLLARQRQAGRFERVKAGRARRQREAVRLRQAVRPLHDHADADRVGIVLGERSRREDKGEEQEGEGEDSAQQPPILPAYGRHSFPHKEGRKKYNAPRFGHLLSFWDSGQPTRNRGRRAKLIIPSSFAWFLGVRQGKGDRRDRTLFPFPPCGERG